MISFFQNPDLCSNKKSVTPVPCTRNLHVAVVFVANLLEPQKVQVKKAVVGLAYDPTMRFKKAASLPLIALAGLLKIGGGGVETTTKKETTNHHKRDMRILRIQFEQPWVFLKFEIDP